MSIFTHKSNNLEHNFIDKLKKTDRKHSIIIKIVSVIFTLNSVVFIQYTYQHVSDGIQMEDISSFMLMIATVFGILLIWDTFQKFRQIDYGQSTILLMKACVDRHRFASRKQIYLLVGMVIPLLIFSSLIYKNTGSSSSLISFLTGAAIGSMVAMFIWNRDSKPLREHAKKVLNELEA
ncbi:hypothetical protein OAT16_01720 [Prolixibacteraceae bacterium]|nr:hypothetical protein [Prolixibacteraceae bacterium]